MAVIIVDGTEYTVADTQNLLQACLSAGLDLPYFCWHPAMGSVGACRQCAVKQFANVDDKQGRLITACMTPVKDGQIISIKDNQSTQFRATVIESLMTNHPHDCPVCEEGGECHLQDMTEMSGHTSRRYRGKKRTHHNQYLGPLLKHEMNRCISCYRCVRFYNDYAGGHDLAAMASHNQLYFGREKDGVLESEFAGNLAEVCPTGVFTDKPFSENYSRKWDLQSAPSVCTHCGVGCNTTPGERYGKIRRVVNRFHSEINGYFLCDRGRFGYAYNHHQQRVLQNKSENSDKTCTDALVRAAKEAITGKAVLLGVGSARASLENNFALREFVGSDNFYSGVSLPDYECQRLLVKQWCRGGLDIASVKQIEQCDAIVILGEDIAETAPRISLALRQAVRNKGIDASRSAGIAAWQDGAVRSYSAQLKTPLFIASLTATRVDDIATSCLHADPREIAQIGFYIADYFSEKDSDAVLSTSQLQWANAVINTLKQANRPLILSGTGYQQVELLRASMALFSALKQKIHNTLFYYAFSEVNSLGLALLLAVKPPRTSAGAAVASTIPDKNQALQDILDPFRAARQQKKRCVLVVLENDLYRSMNKFRIDEIFKNVDELIVLDHTHTQTLAKADSYCAVSTVLESQGTVISSEGRAQRFYSVMPSVNNIMPSWRYLSLSARQLTSDSMIRVPLAFTSLSTWQCCDDIYQTIIRTIPALAPIVKLNTNNEQHLSRQSHRYSGRTAMHANIDVAEKKVQSDKDSLFTYSMEGINLPGPMQNTSWAPGWNSNQAEYKNQKNDGGIRLFTFDSRAVVPRFPRPIFQQDPPSSAILLFPLQHVFGSDELCERSEALSSLMPAPYILINSLDAKSRHLTEGDAVLCTAGYLSQVFDVRLDATLPRGIAGVLLIGIGCLSSHWPVVVTLAQTEKSVNKRLTLIASDGDANNVV
ncbi:MAG: NADH-quinone oxidoreductase subunit NuoG [Spongiibacteraceae bacterium]|nr:NADH-quinone oxidoreductase subunit NuoG [Spongiibacteraceae bacterium]